MYVCIILTSPSKLFFFSSKFLKSSVQIPKENVSGSEQRRKFETSLHPIQLHVILTSCKLLLAYSHICRNKQLK